MRSMSLAIVAAGGALMLAVAGNANAQAFYEWSPQNTKTHLTGTLTFVPTDGNGAYIRCKVALDFETGNVKKGADKPPIIRSAVIKGKGCGSVTFGHLPWYVGAFVPQAGSLSEFYWDAGFENCIAYTGSPFEVLQDGRWAFGGDGGPCLSGALTPNPPVSIVPAQ